MPRSVSVASSTGSPHGTITKDSLDFDFDPVRDGACNSSGIFNPDFTNTATSIPIRDTAKKAGRWSPTPPRDISINSSRVERAFPGFTSGNYDDSMSIERPRAPHNKNFQPPNVPQLRIQTTNAFPTKAPHDVTPSAIGITISPGKSRTFHVRPTSPILDALEQLKGVPKAQIRTEFKQVVNHYKKKFESGELVDTYNRSNYQEATVEDATLDSTSMSHDRPKSFQPKNTRFAKAKPNTSSPLRPHVQQGRVNLKESQHGPVDGFNLPQEEEHIISMVEALREQVQDLEAKAQEFKEARNFALTSCEDTFHNAMAIITALQADCNQKASYIRELELKDDSNQHLQAEYDRKAQYIQELESEVASIPNLRSDRDRKTRHIHELESKVRHFHELEDKVTRLETRISSQETSRATRSAHESLGDKKSAQETSRDTRSSRDVSGANARSSSRATQAPTQDTATAEETRAQGSSRTTWAQDNTEIADTSAHGTYQRTRVPTQDTTTPATKAQSSLRRTRVHTQEHTTPAVNSAQGSLRRTRAPTQDTTTAEARTQGSFQRTRVHTQETTTRVSSRVRGSSQGTRAPQDTAAPAATNAQDTWEPTQDITTTTTATKYTATRSASGRLIPVSKRIRDPDATVRPALEPVRALADVVRGEEDHLRNLKDKRAKLQAQYDAHDPSCGMRKRQSLKKALEDLTIEIEHQFNKIYKLFDVVEVVHDDDTTVGSVRSVTGGMEYTEDLPWDGIEDDE